MPEWRRKERTFTVAPVPSGEASEQTLITAPCWAEFEEVRYVPDGRLVFWNDEKVHLGRHVSLNLRNSGSGAAPARQVMVAWEEEEVTFATTPYDAQERLDNLLRSNPRLYEDRTFDIYSAVRLLENAFELGPEMRAGLVITEQNWQGIVERNYL